MQTKVQIYRLMQDFAEGGAAILFISSDVDEVLNLSHRVLVMHKGQPAAPPLRASEVDKEAVLELFFGRREVA